MTARTVYCHYKSVSLRSWRECVNACTLVPTVFLRHWKTEFELPVSFFVYPRHRKRESECQFACFVFLLYWKRNSNFYFRFSFSHDFVQQNCNYHFRFLILCFRETLKNGIWTSSFVFRFRFSTVLSTKSQKAEKAWAKGKRLGNTQINYACTITNHAAMKWLSRPHYKVKKPAF